MSSGSGSRVPAARWSDGDAYEAYVGRWSRRVAWRFVEWLDPRPRWRWLDVGCGTGALSAVIAAGAVPARVEGVDASAAYVGAATAQAGGPRVRFSVADAVDLPFVQEFDAAVSGLVLNFVPDPAAAVAGMARAVVPGGLVAAYVWDYAEGMQLMRRFWDAAAAVDPSAAARDEAARSPLCRPEALDRLWRSCGLRDVATAAITVPTRFHDADDLWSPFLGAQGTAPTYLAALSDAQRSAVREALLAGVPVAADGSISLTARAWAVRGTAAEHADAEGERRAGRDSNPRPSDP